MARTQPVHPLPVRHAMRKLGQDINVARRRRRIPTRLMAERAGISRSTLQRVERGEPGVSLGVYANVLFSLGLLDRLADLADPAEDRTGLALEEEELPQRIRESRGAIHRSE